MLIRSCTYANKKLHVYSKGMYYVNTTGKEPLDSTYLLDGENWEQLVDRDRLELMRALVCCVGVYLSVTRITTSMHARCIGIHL